MNKVLGHLKTICIHKKWVFYYCWKADIPWRGIKHDLSKFSPTEFFESVKYYQGDRSPIVAAKEANNGMSKAWMHHKGRNTHHYEYWYDNIDNGGVVQMPLYDAIEMLCDYLAAGRTYQGKSFTYIKELEWWKDRRDKPLGMHPQTKKFIDLALVELVQKGNAALNINNLKCLYYIAES